MTDLGFNELTPDQMLEVLLQLCAALVAQDPYVVALAQDIIVKQAELLLIQREALKTACQRAVNEYKASIEADAVVWLREGLADGTLRLMPAAVEAKLIIESGFRAKLDAIKELVETVLLGRAPRTEAERERDRHANPADYNPNRKDDLTDMMRQAAAAQGQANAPNPPPPLAPTNPVPRSSKNPAPWS